MYATRAPATIHHFPVSSSPQQLPQLVLLFLYKTNPLTIFLNTPILLPQMLIHFLNPIFRATRKVLRKPDTLNLLHSTLPLRKQFLFARNIVVRYSGDWNIKEEENESDDQAGAVFALRAVDKNAVVLEVGVC